jgi:hypothetical protein
MQGNEHKMNPAHKGRNVSSEDGPHWRELTEDDRHRQEAALNALIETTRKELTHERKD